MSLKETIKSKICIEPGLPNFPLKQFVESTKDYNPGAVLSCLTVIQRELQYQKKLVENESAEIFNQFDFWDFYCEQVRLYYRMLVFNPAMSQLDFLLQ